MLSTGVTPLKRGVDRWRTCASIKSSFVGGLMIPALPQRVSSLRSNTLRKVYKTRSSWVEFPVKKSTGNAVGEGDALDKNSGLVQTLTGVIKPALAGLLVSCIVLGCPNDSLAAKGGGRVGGNAFSSSRQQTYSAPSSSYSVPSQVYVAPPVYSAPYYAPSPFFGGWGVPFFGPTVAIGVGGPGFGFLGTMVLLVAAFFVISSVTGFLNSSEEEEIWEAQQKSSVVRLQVGLLGLARGLQKDLDRIAENADTTSTEGLHYILSETVLSLLRNPDYCVYGFSTSDVKRDSYEGEQQFNQLSMEERSKFREETLVSVGGVQRRVQRAPKEERFNSEYIVVTIIAATEGELNLPAVNNSSDLRTALTKLGSISADQLQAVEILWTPQNDEDTLNARELLEDYPLLRSL